MLNLKNRPGMLTTSSENAHGMLTDCLSVSGRAVMVMSFLGSLGLSLATLKSSVIHHGLHGALGVVLALPEVLGVVLDHPEVH